MAEFPERIEACFHTKEVNKAGIYLLSFFINGVKTPVIVDDWIPVWKSTGSPCFAKTRDEELWAMLLEKGWSKIQGSYARTASGWCSESIAHLMAVP